MNQLDGRLEPVGSVWNRLVPVGTSWNQLDGWNRLELVGWMDELNQLEPVGSGWNQLERVGTSWNWLDGWLEPAGNG